MIPLKLQIKNFLSYGSEVQTINFSSYHLICLSGKNGHGKSALLDAITWAVWGQARKIAGAVKADHGLLKLGQDHMMVIFDFIFNSQIYRIRREFSLNYGKHQAVLEFGILDPDTDTLQPLTDKTIRATQYTIEQTLGLDYEAFINSSFLRQGHANEFSKKSSKERKEILATILGLNKYENIRKLALEKIKQATIEKNTINALQEKITQELSQKEIIKEKFIQVEKQFQQIAQAEKELAQEQKVIDELQKQLIEKHKKYDLLNYQYKQIEDAEQKQQKKLTELFSTWRSINAQLINGINHQELDIEKKKTVAKIQTYQKELQQTLATKENLLKAKESIQKIEQEHTQQYIHANQEKQLLIDRLETEKKYLTAKNDEIQKQITQHNTDIIKYEQELEQLEKTQTQLLHKQTTFKKFEEQFSKRKAYYQKFIAQGNWLTTELNNLEQKKQLVHNDEDPSCPLCEQNLSASRKRFLKNKFQQSESFIQHQLKRVSHIIHTLKNILIEQHAQLQDQKKEQELINKQEVALNQLTKQITKLSQTHKELINHLQVNDKKIKELVQQIKNETKIFEKLKNDTTQKLQQNKEYKNLYNQLKIYEEQLKKNTYNKDQHQLAEKRLLELETQLTQAEKLKEEQAKQTHRKTEIHNFCKELKQAKQEKQKINLKRTPYKTLTQEEAHIQTKIQHIDVKIKNISQQKEQLFQEKGSLETQQAKCKKLEIEQKEYNKKLEELHNTISDYQAIASATGKDGIQALLIEDAIPEIEQEANDLLSRLTNNQAQIFIESLRDLKSGGTKETLDIKISDAVGIRPYELFSGGEAFRIDFALRIAISKLLARRAGTALQTLIIDEGFGSQDEDGLSHIMDAIYKIQDDFNKIIIVSHLPTMKNQFPVHFVVEKAANGSSVSVIENG